MIRSAGREEEFADVLPVLDRGISVEFVSREEHPDLVVAGVSLKRLWQECPGAGGCYIHSVEGDWEVPQILLPRPNFWQKLITMGALNPHRIGQHETGHSLGLSDQYKQVRSDSHPVYHTAVSDKSVMNSSGSVTCDDADGIINLIDLVRGTSRGGELGWRSLCRKSKTYYVKGKPVSVGPYAIKLGDNGKRWILQTFRHGESIAETEFPLDLQEGLSPFVLLHETVKERDAAGRVALAQGPNGEKIFYSYIYDKRIRLVTHSGRVLLAEITQPLQMASRSYKYGQINYYGEAGNISVVGWKKAGKGKNKEGVAFYELYSPSGFLLELLSLQFEKNGRPYNSLFKQYDVSRSDPAHASASETAENYHITKDIMDEIDRDIEYTRKKEMLREWYLGQ